MFKIQFLDTNGVVSGRTASGFSIAGGVIEYIDGSTGQVYQLKLEDCQHITVDGNPVELPIAQLDN